MLFNSYEFILLFLPICLAGYYSLSRYCGQRAAIGWLACGSMFFYGWWNPAYLGLMTASILYNYTCGLLLARPGASKGLLGLAIAGNLALLGYYKYTDFFIENINALAGFDWQLRHIILPLGISFFTFTQIAYLVDVYRKEAREANIVDYFLFVTYFPHLIAGPIIHHKEMMPQFQPSATRQINADNLMAGTVMFIIGLSKKIFIADKVAVYVAPVFAAADQGATLTFFEAWIGALAYTIQLYFDFSGYADMAIGLSLMFGIKLPLNFDSPHKATSISDFWRRWHMTLSRFLRDYLYIGLGGNRKGEARRYLNLFLTMLLGGIWHGAGWTFVIWGAMHGIYLCINHGWRQIIGQRDRWLPAALRTLCYGSLTFLAVIISWVLFRAETLPGALAVLEGMSGVNGITLPLKYADNHGWLADYGVQFTDNLFESGKQISQLIWPLLIIFLLPNSHTLMRHYRVTVTKFEHTSRLAFRPNGLTLALAFAALLWCFTHLTQLSEFLYFRF